MGSTTSLILGTHAGYVTSLEYLVRRPLGAEALEASYFKGHEHVEEPSSVSSLEYLARGPLGNEALEASYYEGPEYVEETSECLCHFQI
jgi:uncharacterized protein (DUF2132 family)